MTYTEWRDELKSNLLCVSESERRRVLDYYAEAYADRREAGFSEREIIQDFGAPYDAAQRILYEKDDVSEPPRQEQRRTQPSVEQTDYYNSSYAPPPPPPPVPSQNSGSCMWLFVLLCIIFCVPLFGIIMALVGITIGFCVAPIFVIGAGLSSMVGSVAVMISGSVTHGLVMLGGGFVALGVGIILCPIFFKLVKFLWKLFSTIMSAIKSAFSGRGCAV